MTIVTQKYKGYQWHQEIHLFSTALLLQKTCIPPYRWASLRASNGVCNVPNIKHHQRFYYRQTYSSDLGCLARQSTAMVSMLMVTACSYLSCDTAGVNCTVNSGRVHWCYVIINGNDGVFINNIRNYHRHVLRAFLLTNTNSRYVTLYRSNKYDFQNLSDPTQFFM